MQRGNIRQVDWDFRKIPPGKLIVWGLLGVAGILIIYMVLTGFYTVQPDEVGVVKRFGRFVRLTDPGFHLKAPAGIETVDKVKIGKVHKMEFGFRTLEAGRQTRYSQKEYLDESLMLTGDLNIANVEWIVHYKINDPRAWLFNMREVEDTIADTAEVTMRLIVGDGSVTEVLTERRQEIATEAERRMDEALKPYNCGVKIQTVKLQNVDPPREVQSSFNEVNEARQEKETTINQARAAYNKAIPSARGESRKTIQSAEGYAAKRVDEARGDVALFEALRTEYEKAKPITRARLYLEAMAEFLPRIQKITIVDSGTGGLLKVLDLEGGRTRTGGGR